MDGGLWASSRMAARGQWGGVPELAGRNQNLRASSPHILHFSILTVLRAAKSTKMKISRNLFRNMGGFGKSGFLKILIKIRVPGPKSAHFSPPPRARGHGSRLWLCWLRVPRDTGRTRSRSGIASRQCSPVAGGRLHSPETPLCCCLARAQAFFFTRRCPRKPSPILLARSPWGAA